jgi:hypothetical protein
MEIICNFEMLVDSFIYQPAASTFRCRTFYFLINAKVLELNNAVVEIVARWTEFYGIPHHTSLIECISGVEECEAYRRASTKWRLAYGLNWRLPIGNSIHCSNQEEKEEEIHGTF